MTANSLVAKKKAMKEEALWSSATKERRIRKGMLDIFFSIMRTMLLDSGVHDIFISFTRTPKSLPLLKQNFSRLGILDISTANLSQTPHPSLSEYCSQISTILAISYAL